MIKIIKGNILDATEDVICQQVNCKSVMGSGLAKQIRDKYPNVYPEYVKFCKDNKPLLGKIQTSIQSDGKYIANIFGQDDYGRDKRYTDYKALTDGFIKLRIGCLKTNKSLAIPYEIGCGLGGGDWDIVYKIINDVFEGMEVAIYKFK